MIKAVIFDVGGVLVRTVDHSHRRAWERRCGLTPWQSEEIVFGSKMGTMAQAGVVSDDELWQWVGERLELDPEQLALFKSEFWAGDVLDEELVDYARSLRPAYQTAIVSNATDNLMVGLRDKFQIADVFDVIVGSATEKVMKPDPEIFRRALRRLGRTPEECVFIDDNAENVAAAAELGMHTLFFRAGINVPALLAEMGVRPQNAGESGWQVDEQQWRSS